MELSLCVCGVWRPYIVLEGPASPALHILKLHLSALGVKSPIVSPFPV